MVTTTRRRLRLGLVAAASCLGMVAVPGAIYAATSVAAPTITSGPSGPTASTSASFAFTGPKKAAFRCSLDGAAFVTCSSPKAYSGLDQGAHSFAVKAVVDDPGRRTTRKLKALKTVYAKGLKVASTLGHPVIADPVYAAGFAASARRLCKNMRAAVEALGHPQDRGQGPDRATEQRREPGVFLV